MASKTKMGRPRENPPPGQFDRTVGARIRTRKKDAGLTDQQLADKIGRSVSQVFRYQAGDTSVDAETLASIATALGCTSSDLVDGIHRGRK